MNWEKNPNRIENNWNFPNWIGDPAKLNRSKDNAVYPDLGVGVVEAAGLEEEARGEDEDEGKGNWKENLLEQCQRRIRRRASRVAQPPWTFSSQKSWENEKVKPEEEEDVAKSMLIEMSFSSYGPWLSFSRTSRIPILSHKEEALSLSTTNFLFSVHSFLD